jgi:hypothetical protein
MAKKIILAQHNGNLYFGLINSGTVIDPGNTLDIQQIPGGGTK